MPTIGIAVGPRCLGITGLDEVGLETWRRAFSAPGDRVVPLDLASLDGLDRLWSCHAVVLASDGAYAEANLALTLACLNRWCRAGGTLGTVGGAPFLIADRPDGMVADPDVAIDVTEQLITSNVEETGLRVTALGRELCGAWSPPATLLDLNRGSLLPLALYSLPRADLVAIESSEGTPVLSATRHGAGRVVMWGAAVQAPHAAGIASAVAGLIREHLPARPPSRPTAIIDPLRRVAGDRDEVLGLVRLRSTALEAVDEDTGVRHAGWVDAAGVARFALPRTRGPQSLLIAHPDLEGADPTLMCLDPAPESAPEPTDAEPADFDALWAGLRAALDGVDEEAELTRLPALDTSSASGYRLRHPGWDGLELTGVVTVPRGRRPTAAVLALPGYASAGLTALLPELASEAAICALDVRGVGSARRPPPRPNGLLCEGIADPRTSGMVAAALDAVCGYRVLQRLFPSAQVAVHGHSQGGTLGLAVAALEPDVRCVVAGVPFLVAARDAYLRVHTSPYVELQWYLERNPEAVEPGLRTLAYLDPRWLLRRVGRPCLLQLAVDDGVAPCVGLPAVAASLANVTTELGRGGHILPYLPGPRESAERFLRNQLGLDAAAG